MVHLNTNYSDERLWVEILKGRYINFDWQIENPWLPQPDILYPDAVVRDVEVVENIMLVGIDQHPMQVQQTLQQTTSTYRRKDAAPVTMTTSIPAIPPLQLFSVRTEHKSTSDAHYNAVVGAIYVQTNTTTHEPVLIINQAVVP